MIRLFHLVCFVRLIMLVGTLRSEEEMNGLSCDCSVDTLDIVLGCIRGLPHNEPV